MMLQLPLENKSILTDTIYSLLFGVLSIILTQVQFFIPGIGDSNLREIPLLICLFHLRNPAFVFLLSLLAYVGSPVGIPFWMAYCVHLVPLLVGGTAFKWLERLSLPASIKGIVWMLMTASYYLLFLLPLVVVAVTWLPENDGKTFWTLYQSTLSPIRFEAITSSLVTGLYLIQLETRKTLENYNRNLEQIVEQRTKELIVANNELQSLNEELTSSNEGIKSLNENLESLVKERTDKINHQLLQLRRYAHMNSHELRAPLARMLGLLQLLKQEKDPDQMKELLKYLHRSSEELDHVIREMNRLLEKEVAVEKLHA